MSKNCPGCSKNTQRIQILENRISFLERNMLTRNEIHQDRKSRSKHRRSRSRKKQETNSKEIQGDQQKSKPEKPKMSKSMKKLTITQLPEYAPKDDHSIFKSNLDPVAPVFTPREYTTTHSGYIGNDGGASGYQ